MKDARKIFALLGLLGIGALAFIMQSCARSRSDVATISVKPFQQLSEGELSDHLAHGIPVSISARLSGIGSLMVVTLGDGDPVELEVGVILQGKVAVSDDGLVYIRAQLFDPAEQKVVWGPRVFEQSVEYASWLESEIAREIAAALDLQLTPYEVQRLDRQPTKSADAYALYLRALYELHTLAAEEASESAEKNLLEALDHDPDFALAYAGLAVLYMSSGRNEDAQIAAGRALELDPDEAESHWIMGWMHEDRGEWVEAQASYEAGVRLSPSSSTLISRHARLLSWFGRFDEANELMQRALRVDPRSWVRYMYAANVQRMAGNFQRSIELQNTMKELEPLSANRSDTTMLRLLSYVGNQDCRLALSLARDQSENARLFAESLSVLTYVYGKCGELSIALELLGGLEAMAAEGRVRPALMKDWYLTMAYLGVGNNDQAIAALKRSFDDGITGPPLPLAPLDPFWDPVREDPRFIALAERIDLPVKTQP